MCRCEFDPEHLAGASTLPLLVIGTKPDLAEEVREKRNVTSVRSAFADECAAEEITLVRTSKSLTELLTSDV